MKQLDPTVIGYDRLIQSSWADQFDEKQLDVISRGIERGLDIGHYANPAFTHHQMEEILMGLKHGLEVPVTPSQR